MKRLLTEPLLHFGMLGALCYGLWGLYGKPLEPAPDIIVVDEQALLSHMQYRAKAFEPAAFADKLASMNAAERQRLIDEYVREEALYRAAASLDLARGDYVIKLRMIQKMEYLLEDLTPITDPGATELEQYYIAHQSQYQAAPSWTFTHIFFAVDERGEETVRKQVAALLPELIADNVSFDEATEYGDRFPFLQNYVERTEDYITGHFGSGFMGSLRSVPTASWLGPIRSHYGYHLVLVAASSPARMPALTEIHVQVLEDYRRDARALAQERAVAELRRHYQVQVAESLLSVP